eukprot:CAMPEP_0194030630 /NCGR_PEP_ID=MMETSP0009_2-20130614/4038_1 /TAXON_ID=210454 /ORGANISM="Grammatophora oceanica, Strain CCMP 410" /LENGTH=477 /DNA_ID=CAMNT_0038670605 /DNA_START=168 /DNA_END=1601 /DNA_ORIENTATION=-
MTVMPASSRIRALAIAAALLFSSCTSFSVPAQTGCRSTQTRRIPSLHVGLKPKGQETETSSPSPFQDVEDKSNLIDKDADIRQQIGSFSPEQFVDSGAGGIEITSTNELSEEESNTQIGIWAARGVLLLVAVIWGTNFASVKYLENLCFHPPCNHPPSEAAFARFGVAGLVSIPLVIGQKWEVILAGIECGLWITIGYISQAMALQSIPSGKCAFICSLTVVVVPLMGKFFFGKELKPINLVSAVIALAGVGVLEGMISWQEIMGIHPAMAEPTTAATAVTALASSTLTEANAGPVGALAKTLGVGKGDLLALGQPIGFGLSFMRIEHYVEKFKDVKNRVLTISASECIAVGLCSLAWVLYDYHGTLPDFGYMVEYHRLIAIAWTGIMTTVVAIYFEGLALQTASATDAAITFASEPVWASLFGAWLLREKLNVNTYVGGSIILVACLLGAIADLPGFKKSEEDTGEVIDVDSTPEP